MTNKEMFTYRMEICAPLNKLNPFAEWQEMNGVRFKPCGCFMDVKARMALQECPAKLWGAVVDSNVIDEAKELIKVIKESGKVTGEQRKVLGQLKGIIQGGKAVALRHCVGCVSKLVDELGHQLKREETELINEVEQPQPKKRGRKRRTE